ncbi:hypothetical protein [Paenibacillus amylolyticus]|uniref:Uncharacterized protein n=1 Tax=Paenibacillus amylolyticus TaxID=1451 RepID=A0ABD8B1Z5_PAEAM
MYGTRNTAHDRKVPQIYRDYAFELPQQVRHTFGHDLLEATKDLQKVANLMGHYKENGDPNIAMTMIYTTPSKEDLEDAVETIS